MTERRIEADETPCPLTVGEWMTFLTAESQAEFGNKHLVIAVALMVSTVALAVFSILLACMSGLTACATNPNLGSFINTLAINQY